MSQSAVVGYDRAQDSKRWRVRLERDRGARHGRGEDEEYDFVFANDWLEDQRLERAWREPAENTSEESTESVRKGEKSVDARLIRLPPAQPSVRRFEVLQQWEGIIIEHDSEVATVELADLTNPGERKEIAELSLCEFAVSDRSLLGSGCVFYWTIGYDTTPGGQVRRLSEIRVRRTPRWTETEIENAKRKGQELFRQLTSNESDSASR